MFEQEVATLDFDGTLLQWHEGLKMAEAQHRLDGGEVARLTPATRQDIGTGVRHHAPAQ